MAFADDTKLLPRVSNPEERDQLQADLNRLGAWSTKWQMKFNVEKCKVLQLGKNNLNYKYNLNEQELEPVVEERDLGIIITNDLKVDLSRHCKSAYNKAV